MTVMDGLWAWLKTAPVFASVRLDMDCLQAAPDRFSLDSVPGERVIKRYLDGGTVRRQLFIVSSRAVYGANLAQQKANLQLFEDLENWIDDRALRGALPVLGEGRRARSLVVLSTPYLMEAEEGSGPATARYQIQLELIYLQGGNSE